MIPTLVSQQSGPLLDTWVNAQLASSAVRRDLMSEAELRAESTDFLRRLAGAAQTGDLEHLDASAWEPVRDMLTSLSRSRAVQGFSPSETASFILSFKQPLFNALSDALREDPARLADEMWNASLLLDRLGLITVEAYQASREELIRRQQQELLELSTPVVKIWNGVVAVPLIGTLDSARTQVVMENLLQQIVENGASVAIIDITGVPLVDTLVAQHLIKTVAAARLMGAECIISGIRPQIAQTIVHLGINLESVPTKATLADAIALALRQRGLMVTKAPTVRAEPGA